MLREITQADIPDSHGPRVEAIFVSPAHNYWYHHGKPAGTHPTLSLDRVRCVAGRGLEGDRFFEKEPDDVGQVTFFAAETHEAILRAIGRTDVSPGAYRRNVIVRGLVLGSLVGREFSLQGIRFLGTEEASPCHWMDTAVGPGTLAVMAKLPAGGGLRAKILDDGVLAVGG